VLRLVALGVRHGAQGAGAQEIAETLGYLTIKSMQGLRLTPEQSRAARALLGWSREVLAKKARVHHQTIFGFESGMNCLPTTICQIRRALERAGVAFIDEGSRDLFAS
jgi:DNA-binding XRE family transcriptional regulator